jgi:hypothetical protein
MYVPPNISPAGSTYATVTPLQAPAAVTSQDIAGARQTQIAITGPGAALIPNSAGGRPITVVQPRPAYIAAQFLAQDVTPEEAEQFFAPELPPQVTTTTARELFTPRAVQSDIPNMSSTNARQSSAPIVTGQIAPAQPVVQRSVQAYNASNTRNALLASTPEVDTSS